MALAISTITHSISTLSVSGLTIKDKDEIQTTRDRVPVLIPLTNFITDFSVERNSYGGAAAKMTVRYTLNYRLLYAPLGDGRSNILEIFSSMVDMFGLIWDAILAEDTLTGSIDHEGLNGVVTMGPVEAPDGVPYWGCDIPLANMEFVN